MGCDRYTVLIGGIDGVVAGEGMALDYAVMFAKALFNEYWNDADISVTIKKEANKYAQIY